MSVVWLLPLAVFAVGSILVAVAAARLRAEATALTQSLQAVRVDLPRSVRQLQVEGEEVGAGLSTLQARSRTGRLGVGRR